MPDYLNNFSFSLELFLNVLEFLALLASIFTFLFFMMNQYTKALRAVLSPMGMGFWNRLRVLFLCRKSAVKKRAFLEYALLKTQGRGMIFSSWNALINEFKAFYPEGQAEIVYTIPNCTALIGADFSEAAARYFAFLSRKKARKAFGVPEGPLKWVITIHVDEAYATPTCLLSGLLSKYEENWEEFIKRYVSTAYITDSDDCSADDILSNELYMTFAWLLWGPSYEISYRKYWAGLCQLSYGDESNSVPAVANPDTIEMLRESFSENASKRYGTLLSPDISLYEKKSYYHKIREYANPENAYFYDKIERNDLSFAAQIERFTPCTNYKSKKYYCTAYVWLLFEVEGEEFGFRPEKSLAFFEHANLADNDTYGFLTNTLIEKSLTHFKSVFADPKLDGRKYRFVCALNEKIETACKRRYAELAAEDTEFGRALRERVIFEPKHSAITAFAAYDDFFTPSNRLSFQSVSAGDRESIADLGNFYTEIYMDCFPDPNERETFDHLLYYLKAGESATEYQYHIELVKDEDGQIIGGCIFDYFAKSNSGVIEFLAIKSNLQSAGIGTTLYKHVLAVLDSDAYRARKAPLDCVFCEIDAPEREDPTGAKKYLYFWNKNGYKHLDFRYIQPSLSATQARVENLWLVVAQLKAANQTIPGELVESVLWDYLKYAMQIPEPERNADFAEMQKELREKGAVTLSGIL